MAEALELAFLGSVEVRRAGVPVAGLRPGKGLALLSYLAVTARPHLRPALAGLLWGEMTEARAHNNLRKTLSQLRGMIGPHLMITRQSVAFNREAAYWLDVEVFEAAAGRAAEGPASIKRLGEAVDLYRGDFLEGFHVRQALAFEEWVLAQRARLRELALQALQTLAAHHAGRGEAGHAAGIDYTTRLLALEPWREEAHQQLMLLLARSGQRSAALAQYETCRELLGEELGVEPGEQTTRLYEQIRDGELEIPLVAPVVITPPEPVPHRPRFLEEDEAEVEPSVFVARERELAWLNRALEGALLGKGQVVFVTGGPGRGKTALLGEFARRAMDAHPELLLALGAGGAYAGVGDPYLPFREVLAMLSGELERRWASGVLSTEHARRIWGALPEVGAVLAERGSDLVGTLLPGRELLDRGRATAPAGAGWLEELARLHGRDAPARGLEQSHIFEQVANVLLDLSAQHPLLIVLDDLQWADLASVSLLFHLGRRLGRGRILLAGAYRPHELALGRDGQRHPLEPVLAELRTRFGDVWLDLTAADEAGGRRFVDQFLDTEPNRLAEGFRGALFRRTGGHALFTIELLQAMQGRGDLVRDEAGCWSEGERLAWDALPARAEAAIAERIARLPEELRSLLAAASVEGEEFTAQAVARVQGVDELEALRLLRGELAGRHRLVREQGETRVDGSSLSRYRFAHFLFQQHLYEGLGEGERRLLHGEIGAILEELYAGHTEAVAVQLARHYSLAGLSEKAVGYLLQAGDRARTLYAHQEAVEHYEKALEFLKDAGDLDGAARALMKLGVTHHTAFQFERSRQAYDEGFALWQRAATVEPAVPPPPAPHALRLITRNEPFSLDPTVDSFFGTREVVGQLYSGLVELGLDMDIVPDIAHRWEISEAGRRYVFHLRDDARWSDGAPVTAHDFQVALLRVLDPTTAPIVAGQLFDIQGGRAFHQRRAQDPAGVGVRAPDDHTLIVDLEGPAGHFLHVLAWMYPVPRHVVEAHDQAWTEPGNLVTNGPFRLEDWEPGRLMTFNRNPSYHGRFRGNAEQVELCLLPVSGSQTEMEMYEAGEIDAVLLPYVDVAPLRQRYAGEYVSGPSLVTWYLMFDASRPPFDDRRVRLALALAIDNETITDAVFGGDLPPATGGLVPPAMPGHSPGIGFPHDPDRARRLLAQAGYPGGRGFPAVKAVARPGRGAELVVDHHRTQWRQELGIDIAWEAGELTLFLDKQKRALYHITLDGWLADYPDPDSFLRGTGAEIHRATHWEHEEYDRLVEEATRSMDQARRMELYRRADRILVEEAIIAPVFYGRSHHLVKPWVKRFPRSAIREWFWKDVVLEPH